MQPGQSQADVLNTLLIVQQETSPRTRVSILAQLSVVDILDQTASLVQQVG